MTAPAATVEAKMHWIGGERVASRWPDPATSTADIGFPQTR